MIIPDINLLLYAYNAHVPQHRAAHRWWSKMVAGTELLGLPHEVTFGFVRIATNRRLGEAAIGLSEARTTVESWLSLPQARVLLPTSNHWELVMDLMTEAQASGGLLSDAVLAAYAIENRATLNTNDADFGRFGKRLAWTNPLIA